MSVRLDSVTLCAPDPSPAIAFYDATLAALGLVRLDELVDEEEDDAAVEAVGWGEPGSSALLWVVTGERVSTGTHLRFTATDAQQVRASHRAAVAAGGRSHAAPRRWTVYRRGEFGTSVLDPLGNLVEVVAPE